MSTELVEVIEVEEQSPDVIDAEVKEINVTLDLIYSAQYDKLKYKREYVDEVFEFYGINYLEPVKEELLTEIYQLATNSIEPIELRRKYESPTGRSDGIKTYLGMRTYAIYKGLVISKKYNMLSNNTYLMICALSNASTYIHDKNFTESNLRSLRRVSTDLDTCWVYDISEWKALTIDEAEILIEENFIRPKTSMVMKISEGEFVLSFVFSDQNKKAEYKPYHSTHILYDKQEIKFFESAEEALNCASSLGLSPTYHDYAV